jgi:hypothetical protein
VELLTGETRAASDEPRDAELHAQVECNLPSRVAVGAGSAIFVAGSCFHERRRIRKMWIGPPRGKVRVIAHGMPKADAPEAPDFDPEAARHRSGFWGIVPFAPVSNPCSVELGATVELFAGTGPARSRHA